MVAVCSPKVITYLPRLNPENNHISKLCEVDLLALVRARMDFQS